MPSFADSRSPSDGLLDQAGVGIARLSADGRFMLVNPAYCALAARGRDDLLRLPITAVVHPDHTRAAVAELARCVASGQPATSETCYLRPDGSATWVESSVAALRSPAGVIDAVLVVAHDISRRKATERDLVDAEERYRLIGRATNDVIWDWDHRSGLVVWSQSLSTVFGYAPADATGPIDEALQWWGGRIHPGERAEVLGSFQAAAYSDAETWAKEYRFLAADGSYRQVIDRGYIARDESGGPVRMVGSMQDITPLRLAAIEREQLLTRLEEERKKLETVLHYLPAGVILADAGGRLVFVNPQVEIIWRHPPVPTEGVADYGHWKGLHPDGRPLKPEEWPLARALRHGEVVRDEAIHFERGDGTTGIMQVSASPVESAAGAIAGGVVVFSDITERERVHEMARLAQREAETASRMKDEFLAVLSHELRTPLNAILGWTQMIARDSLPADRVAKALHIIERNARVQVQMVEDLLDVSAIVQGKLGLDFAAVNVKATLQAAIESVRLTADEKGVQLSVALEDVGTRRCDGARLQQVGWNLVSNALKFTPAGGRIDVELSRDAGDRVRVVVRDTGIGIAPAFLPHIFDRFRQGDATATREQGGLGLGLSIVQHITTALSGTVAVASEGIGRGATFTVVLPLEPVEATTA